MNAEIGFRPAESVDNPALARLVSASPSSGRASFAYDYQADVLKIHRAFADELHAIVATSGSKVIAMVLGDVSQVQWEGQVCRAAYVSNLRVAHDYRRQGVAKRLLDFSSGYIEELLGANPMVYSAIPEGNVSQALARTYRCQATRTIQGGVVPMRRSAPAITPGLTVRAAEQADLPAVADGMNNFYRQHNLWSPVTASWLDRYCDTRVAGIRPNALYVVARGGRITAGLSVSDRTRLIRMKIVNLTGYARLLGTLLGILPRNGLLRTLSVRQVWFAEGELASARYLWSTLRHTLRAQGHSLGIAYDPHDKLAGVFQLPFWLPMFQARYAVRADAALDPERPIYCLAGP